MFIFISKLVFTFFCCSGPMQDTNYEDWTIGGGYIGLGGNGLYAATFLVSGFQVIYG